MKIKMLTLQAGPQGVREAGKTYEVPEKEAKALIVGGYALSAEKTVEKATNRASKEKATAPEAAAD